MDEDLFLVDGIFSPLRVSRGIRSIHNRQKLLILKTMLCTEGRLRGAFEYQLTVVDLQTYVVDNVITVIVPNTAA